MAEITIGNPTTTTTVITVADAAKNNKQMEILKKNRIQVSNTKKPLFFYLNLAKKYIKQHNDVVLSALGMAIPTVITIAGILKMNGLAMEKEVSTSTVGTQDEAKGRLVQKPKIEILLERTENVEKMTIAAKEAPKKDAAKKERKIGIEELDVTAGKTS
ncbi:DNA/RNA-binding protein Alba-like protein [Actinidia chinensis var. chinensis]|uniref:DNA/RNA-binding protein Alba-like protein n=1 Tax=Actinidia chinensis var. chinensis TaxID=1590841 RepID=A0A2R6RUU7_ACTCC|nr:DNA/RNA-binding protein Alba-like protein [Actinidia chinensis var. chinensis]